MGDGRTVGKKSKSKSMIDVDKAWIVDGAVQVLKKGTSNITKMQK